MTRTGEAEPSWFRPPVFMIGQDHRGNWVVQKGIAGGLFVTRSAALRYVRSESGYQARVVVMISGNFELNVDSKSGNLPPPIRSVAHQPPRLRTA